MKRVYNKYLVYKLPSEEATSRLKSELFKNTNMYFTVTYDILSADPSEVDKIKMCFKDALNGLRWVKPLTSYYVVQCNNEDLRIGVLQKLKDTYEMYPKKIRFIITPLIDGGQVVGVTAGSLWPTLKEITRIDDNDILSML